MPKINRESSKHKTEFRTKDGDTWEPYSDDKQIALVTSAFTEIQKQIIQNKGVLKTCNAAFAKLLGGRDFAAIWKDPDIWVSFNSNKADGIFGITYKKDIAIAAYVFAQKNPVRLIAATLVHELAHVNGAPSGAESKDAESTLPQCGFDDMYNPATVGVVLRPKQIYLA
jgi:hypothetical protein